MRARKGQNGRTLLAIALDYRCGANGSYERSLQDQLDDKLLLEDALRTWDPSVDRYEQFDNAVKSLILAALSEGNR